MHNKIAFHVALRVTSRSVVYRHENCCKQDWQRPPLLLYFQGYDAIGKRHTAQFLADNLEISLLIADLAQLLEEKTNF
mgnify:FL=1